MNYSDYYYNQKQRGLTVSEVSSTLEKLSKTLAGITPPKNKKRNKVNKTAVSLEEIANRR